MSVTLVTCYYRIKSKHSFQEYDRWISNLSQKFNGNIIIFTSSDLEEKMKESFVERSKVVVKEMKDFYLNQKYDSEFWEKQYSMDNPRKHMHRTKECYMIWNSKFSFLREAIEMNPFESDKFVWNDVGSLRDGRDISRYPIHKNVSSDKLDIINVQRIKSREYYQNGVGLSGAMFGGGKDLLLDLCEKYYKCFQDYVDRGLFIGCDQQLICTLLHRHPELFNTVKSNDWFYLYKYYQKD